MLRVTSIFYVFHFCSTPLYKIFILLPFSLYYTYKAKFTFVFDYVSQVNGTIYKQDK